MHKAELQAPPELPEPELELAPELLPVPELLPETEPELLLVPEPELLLELLASGVLLPLDELQAPTVAIARTEAEPMTMRHANENFS